MMKHKYASVYGESFRNLAELPETVSIKYMHDVNAPLLGAVRMLGLENENVALVTLGTGLGFSFALCGEVQAGETGGPVMGLWDRPWNGGILEDRISARGICAAYAGSGVAPLPSVSAIAKAAYAGDSVALEVFAGTGDLLGKVLKPVADELHLDIILMGGQVSKSLSLMLEPLQAQLPGIKIQAAPEGAVFKGLESLF